MYAQKHQTSQTTLKRISQVAKLEYIGWQDVVLRLILSLHELHSDIFLDIWILVYSVVKVSGSFAAKASGYRRNRVDSGSPRTQAVRVCRA